MIFLINCFRLIYSLTIYQTGVFMIICSLSAYYDRLLYNWDRKNMLLVSQYVYKYFNKHIFNNTLENVKFEIIMMDNIITAAQYDYRSIIRFNELFFINEYLFINKSFLAFCKHLVHEMVHHKLWTNNKNMQHNEYFFDEMKHIGIIEDNRKYLEDKIIRNGLFDIYYNKLRKKIRWRTDSSYFYDGRFLAEPLI